jgi:hypothetical protein
MSMATFAAPSKQRPAMPVPHRWTLAQYRQLAQFNLFNDQRTMLLDGELSSLTVDTTIKAEAYATAGVPEYWVIDLDARQLIVFTDPVALPAGLGTTAYKSKSIYPETDRVAPRTNPNAIVAVADLLP